jgi:hypothetical protein
MSGGPEHAPLDPADFTLYGYGDRLAALEASVRKLRLWTREPTTTVVEDAVFVPVENRKEGHLTAIGGILDAEGNPVKPAQGRRRGLPGPMQIDAEREVDQEVVYLGWVFNHYGHFLLETLARSWLLDDIDPSIPVVFHSGAGIPTGVYPRILELFRIPPSRILELNVPTRLRRVIVPEPLYRLHDSAHVQAAKPHKNAAMRLLEAPIDQPSAQPVYLSRRLVNSDQRFIVNESVLESVLRENGFLIVHPEAMPFDEQVRLFNNHSQIFSCDSSALHTVLFAFGSPKLHVLTGQTFFEGFLADYFLVSKVTGATATFIRTLGSQGHELESRNTPVLMEASNILPYLADNGFLSRRNRSTLWTRRPSRAPEYDSAWHCSQIRSAIGSGQDLPDGDLKSAAELAPDWWPLCWNLARYFVTRNSALVTPLVQGFLGLVDMENDLDRLALYRPEVEKTHGQILPVCEQETAAKLVDALKNRFGITTPSKKEFLANSQDGPTQSASREWAKSGRVEVAANDGASSIPDLVVRRIPAEELIRKIDARDPFAFSRWGDGEWHSLFGRVEGRNRCGHRYFPEMGVELKRVLLGRPSYVLGMQDLALRIYKGRIEKWLFENNLDNLDWINADVFHKLSSKGRIDPLVESLRNTPALVLVGPNHLRKLEGYLGFGKFVEVPLPDCYLTMGQTLAKLKKVSKKLPIGSVIAISAAMPANLMIDALARTEAGRRLILIDLGSVWDPYAGVKSRSYMKDMDVAVQT